MIGDEEQTFKVADQKNQKARRGISHTVELVPPTFRLDVRDIVRIFGQCVGKCHRGWGELVILETN
jgi:hypothetical protein